VGSRPRLPTAHRLAVRTWSFLAVHRRRQVGHTALSQGERVGRRRRSSAGAGRVRGHSVMPASTVLTSTASRTSGTNSSGSPCTMPPFQFRLACAAIRERGELGHARGECNRLARSWSGTVAFPGHESDPSPVRRRLEKAPSLDTLSPRERAAPPLGVLEQP